LEGRLTVVGGSRVYRVSRRRIKNKGGPKQLIKAMGAIQSN